MRSPVAPFQWPSRTACDEDAHALAVALDLGQHVDAVDHHVLVAAQRRVQRGPVLGHVHALAREEPLDRRGQPALARERAQERSSVSAVTRCFEKSTAMPAQENVSAAPRAGSSSQSCAMRASRRARRGARGAPARRGMR